MRMTLANTATGTADTRMMTRSSHGRRTRSARPTESAAEVNNMLNPLHAFSTSSAILDMENDTFAVRRVANGLQREFRRDGRDLLKLPAERVLDAVRQRKHEHEGRQRRPQPAQRGPTAQQQRHATEVNHQRDR